MDDQMILVRRSLSCMVGIKARSRWCRVQSRVKMTECTGNASHDPATQVWRASLDKVVSACVVLRVTQVRPFDTESAKSSYATGFVVDKEKGLILTNRHVATPGPTTSEAVFLNREEVPVHPIYYDPIHDFAFMRFDPGKIKFMDVQEVELAPEAASVGLDIRVVGNDSGEKVSILAGTIARLDRDAPTYGRKSYNDFNTFYIQAASGTKGGSSGSPVVDCNGRAVGLNAGGKNKAASAFYLPLERVVRALRILQGSKINGFWKAPYISRGDFQTTFVFKGFDEVRRLGLSTDIEEKVRNNNTASGGAVTGMLVVENVLPGGPAHNILHPGDVLIKLQDQIITQFLPMEEILDKNVGKHVKLELDRGGEQILCNIQVADVHSVTPSSFLEYCGSSIHALSYQQARNHCVEAGQVYVAEPGYVLGRARIPKHAILTKINGMPISDVETFAGMIKSMKHGTRAPIEYYTFSDRHRKSNAIIQTDGVWYGPPLIWRRNDEAGMWSSSEDVKYGQHAAIHSTVLPASDDTYPHKLLEEDLPNAKEHEASEFDRRMRESMVLVDVDIPNIALADGVHSKSFTGTGIVVHHSENLGLVLVDRNTVPIGPCDVMLSFGGHPIELSATVRFLHPLHNFGIVSYNPSDLPTEAHGNIVAAELLPTPPLKCGDSVFLVGLTETVNIIQRKSTVTNSTVSYSASGAETPRFRAVHEELINLDDGFGDKFNGILTDEKGRVRAFWASFSEQVNREDREWSAGMHTDTFYYWVEKVKQYESSITKLSPDVWVLNAELEPFPLSKAVHLGLPKSWIARLAGNDPYRRQVVKVRGRAAESHASKILMDNDVILAINSQLVSSIKQVEKIIFATSEDFEREKGQTLRQRDQMIPGQEIPNINSTGLEGQSKGSINQLKMTVFRNREVMEVSVPLGIEPGISPGRLVQWCGALLQEPHRAVRELGYVPEGASGVFVSRWHHGSPAHRYGLYAQHWIVEVLTVKLDTLYWPTLELCLHNHSCKWQLT